MENETENEREKGEDGGGRQAGRQRKRCRSNKWTYDRSVWLGPLRFESLAHTQCVDFVYNMFCCFCKALHAIIYHLFWINVDIGKTTCVLLYTLIVHANSNHSIQTQKQYKCVHFSIGLVSSLFTQNACNTNVVTHLFLVQIQCPMFIFPKQRFLFSPCVFSPPPPPLLSLCSLCLRSAHFCCPLKTVPFFRSFIFIVLILIFRV